MKKRYELSSIKCDIKTSDIPVDPSVPDSIENPDSLPSSGPIFTLRGENLPGFLPTNPAVVTDESGVMHNSMQGWPEGNLSFNVTSDDLTRANAWFTGNYTGVSIPESETLKKNRTAAVRNLLSNYFSTCLSHNLFPAPFLIGWAYRLKEGTLSTMRGSRLMTASREAPNLPILKGQVEDKTVYTDVGIRNIPARLFFGIPYETMDELQSAVTAIEIYACEPTPLYAADMNVSGLRSVNIDGVPVRCWYYDHYDAADIIRAAEADSDFRLLHVIKFDEIENFDTYLPLPLAAGALANLKKQPSFAERYKENGGASPEPPAAEGNRKIKLLTEALDLGHNEERKRVKAVTLRGLFERENITLRLYASRHRETPQLIAMSRGPYLRGLCGMRFRWFYVEVETALRPGDFLEALTFEYAL